jgi:DsbE subfamily thiol:disulfide oxidoreductase
MSRLAVVAPVTLFLVGLLALLVAGLAMQASASTAPGRTSDAPTDARPAPEIVLSGFDGQTTKLSDLRGQVVVVNFWASWCAPCRDETAALERVWKRYAGSRVRFVGVATWDSQQAARDFAQASGVTYLNGTDANGDAAVAYAVTGIPETFLVDPNGQIVHRWIGQIDEASLDSALAAITRQGPRALADFPRHLAPTWRA